MAPLNAGQVMNLRLVDPLGDRVGPLPTDFETIGAYLRAVRRHRRLSLEELAETTRISKIYLQALEEGDQTPLPSRPFAIGYVRAYATALGIDGHLAAARFKAETPDFSEPLRNPIGVKHEETGRNPLIFLPVLLLVAGVVFWNVTQHQLNDTRAAPTVGLSIAPPALPKAPGGPIALGAATPPPADQTMPVAYVTPGLDKAAQGVNAQGPGSAKAAPAGPETSAYAAPAIFTPKGMIYGAAPAVPAVVVQARKSTALIVRGSGGAVYFARQLEAGEAYRAPIGIGLSADIGDPAALDIYINGRLQASPPAGMTPIDKMAAQPTPAATPVQGAVSR